MLTIKNTILSVKKIIVNLSKKLSNNLLSNIILGFQDLINDISQEIYKFILESNKKVGIKLYLFIIIIFDNFHLWFN